MEMRKYTHLELESEMHVLAGYYCPQKEVRLPYDGQEVLYVMGNACIDNSCCSNGRWSYALVPGYISRWQGETNQDGQPVSEVIPITGEANRSRISKLIKDTEAVTQVDFW